VWKQQWRRWKGILSHLFLTFIVQYKLMEAQVPIDVEGGVIACCYCFNNCCIDGDGGVISCCYCFNNCCIDGDGGVISCCYCFNKCCIDGDGGVISCCYCFNNCRLGWWQLPTMKGEVPPLPLLLVEDGLVDDDGGFCWCCWLCFSWPRS
jgi:hypothetical protein